MRKPIAIGLWIVLLALIVLAAAPTTPPTLAPANNSVYFYGNNPVLTCSGSTDADADTIYYQFFNTTGYVTAYLTEYNISTTTMNWTDAKTYCQGKGTGWNLTSIESAAENINVWNNATVLYGADYIWLGGNSFSAENTWIWQLTGITFYTGFAPTGSCLIYCNWSTRPALDYPITTIGNEFNCSFMCGDENAGGTCYGKDWENDACSGTNKVAACEINRTINPIPMQNSTATTYTWTGLAPGQSYQWLCKACDNSSRADCSGLTENRTITMMNFSNCTTGNIALHFTGYDEETLAALQPSMDLGLSLTLSSAADSELYYYSLNTSNNYSFCLTPNNIAVNATGLIEYGANNASYSYPRQYYFDTAEIIGNSEQDIGLYQLQDSLATAVTFNAIRNGEGVPNVIIHVQRYNPGTGVYTLVAMGTTSSSGSDVIYLRLTDAWYRVLAYENGNLVYASEAVHLTSSTYNMYLSGSSESSYTSYWDYWNSLDTITYSLTFNNATNYTSLLVDDSTGAATLMCLKVDKFVAGNMTNVCYNCTETASATLSCYLADNDAYHIAKFVAYRDDVWRVIDTLDIDLTSSLKDLIGQDGLVYSFLVTGTLAFVGLFNPVVAILLGILGLIASISLGLVSLAWGAVAGLIVAAGVLIFKMK